MGQSLQDWIRLVEERAPGEIVRVKKQVAPSRFESSCVVDALERQGRFPAVLFESVADLKGRPSPCRILNNTFGTFRKIALALGLDTGDRMPILETILERSTRLVPVKTVAAADAPVKARVIPKDRIDLSLLPGIRHTDLDGGPYFTPVVVSKDAAGRHNVSWNRMQYLDRKHLAIYMSPRHLWAYFAAAEAQNQSLPIAVVLGHHPAFHLTGALLNPLHVDEYEATGGVLGEGLEVTPSETWGDRFLIPAQSEIVIEGRILPHKRCVEGPFGDSRATAVPSGSPGLWRSMRWPCVRRLSSSTSSLARPNT